MQASDQSHFANGSANRSVSGLVVDAADGFATGAGVMHY